MIKKAVFSLMALSLLLSGVLMVPSAKAADQVCGLDGITYDSTEAAEAAGADVSYSGACLVVTSENNLYEAKTEINFAGMLIEVGSTDIPTNIIVRDNGTKTDYTVSITADTILGLSGQKVTTLDNWIPGDQIRVIGEKNENTQVIEASRVANLTIENNNLGANGWITKIDKEAKKITYQWANVEHIFLYNDDTRFVAGLKNPASVDDLAVNDRIRARLVRNSDGSNTAKIVVVLRRGSDLYMKIRTFTPIVTLVRLDSTVIPTTIQVKIEKTPGLKANDVNNLLGQEGALVTVNVTEDTNIVRKYFGKATLAEFTVGDRMRVVGRVNDDGTIDAKLIKDESIWKVNTLGHAGEVKEVNVEENYLTITWTPVMQLTKTKLKEMLEEKAETVTAQMAKTASSTPNGSRNITFLERLKNKVQNLTTKLQEKVGKFTRKIQTKKVAINRIKAGETTLGDLIKRMPEREMKVLVDENTEIVVGNNTSASLSDIQVGDKVRVRGVRNVKLGTITATAIAVVADLPEVDVDLDETIDNVNEITTEIVTEETDGSVSGDTETETEEVVTDGEES